MSHIHIPDGVLPAWLWVGGWLLTLALLAIAGRASSRADVRRKVPLLAVVSSVMLVAMSSEIVPIAYHINLTVLAGVLLGPVLSIIAAFITEIVLALLGHGGVTVLGLNTLLVSTEMVIGWVLLRGFLRLIPAPNPRSLRIAAVAATFVTLAITTTALVGIVALAGGGSAATRETGALDPTTLTFANPFSGGVFDVGLFSGGEGEPAAKDAAAEGALSVRRFALVVYALGPLGWLLEGFVTAAVLGYIFRVRPGLLTRGPLGTEHPQPAGDEGVGH